MNGRRSRTANEWRSSAACLCLFAALALTSCAQNPVSGQQNFVLMSETEEIAAGKSDDPKIRKEYGVYGDAALQRYVNEVGQRLAAASHRPGLSYHFLVVDSAEVNAFALPGGYIYVTRGMLAYLNSEAELAAVLGHELGHVTARHSVQQASAAAAAGIGATLLQIFVPQARGAVGDTAINTLSGALLSGYGREQELEADRLGAEYLARTGYEPQAMVNVVRVLKNQELFDAEVAKSEGRAPRGYHGLFASHPDNDTRLQQVVSEAARLARPPARREQASSERFLRHIDRLTFGDSPDQGIFREGEFLHPVLGFAMRFPRGWRLRNNPQNVLAATPAGDALIDLRAGGPARGSPEQVLRRNVNLPSGTTVAATTVNGLHAAAAGAVIGGAPTRVLCIFLGDAAYLVAAQSRNAETFARYRREIDLALGSFHAVTPDESARARPLRVRVISAPPGMTFGELARRSPTGRNAEGYLRVLNGMYPTGEPAAGQALKVIE